MKGPNLSSRIFKKSPAGGPDAEEMSNVQVPEELHWKIFRCQEKGN